MLLITYSSTVNQDFNIIQNFLSQKFADTYVKRCTVFNSAGRNTTEISFLFLEKEVKVFYSIPRCDEYDTFILENRNSMQKLLMDIFNLFADEVSVSAHLHDTLPSSKQYIHLYLPEDCKTDCPELNTFFRNHNNLDVHLRIYPSETKEIQLILHTYDELISSITNVIDGSNKIDFIPRFFSLVILLMYGR